MKLGAALKQLREAQGVTLEKIALEAGTDVGNLSRIERGTQKPNIELVAKIAAALQIRMSALYLLLEEREALSNATNDRDEESIRLIRLFKSLTPANQTLAVEFLKLLRKQQEKLG